MVRIQLFPPFSEQLKIKDYFLDISTPRKIIELPVLAKENGNDIFQSISGALKCDDFDEFFERILIIKNDEVATADDYVQDGDVIKIVLPLQGG